MSVPGGTVTGTSPDVEENPIMETTHIDVTIPEDALDTVTSAIDYTDHQAWIPWVWAALAQADDVPARFDEDDEAYPSHLLTLAALGHLFERFHDANNGTDSDPEPTVGASLAPDAFDPYSDAALNQGSIWDKAGTSAWLMGELDRG